MYITMKRVHIFPMYVHIHHVPLILNVATKIFLRCSSGKLLKLISSTSVSLNMFGETSHKQIYTIFKLNNLTCVLSTPYYYVLSNNLN